MSVAIDLAGKTVLVSGGSSGIGRRPTPERHSTFPVPNRWANTETPLR